MDARSSVSNPSIEEMLLDVAASPVRLQVEYECLLRRTQLYKDFGSCAWLEVTAGVRFVGFDQLRRYSLKLCGNCGTNYNDFDALFALNL
jgi:hypothetical protein